MASRILFEEEITEPVLNQAADESLDTNLESKQEDDTDKANSGKEQNAISSNNGNMQETTSKPPCDLVEDNNDTSHGDETGKIDQENDGGVNIAYKKTTDSEMSSVQIIGTKKNDDKPIDTKYDFEDNSSHDKKEDIRIIEKTYEVMIEEINDNTMQVSDQEEGINSKKNNTHLDETDQNPTKDKPTKVKKTKGKFKRPSELQLLGVDIKVDDEALENTFDVFGDDSKIYRKYKLRKTEQAITYTEPNDLKPEEWGFLEYKPKRRTSSDDDNNPLRCGVCKRDFDTKQALQLHVRCHENTVLEYKCALCSEKFNKNSDLIAHKSTHASESFLCEKCKVAFSDHCDFLIHNLIHTNKSNMTCPECGLHYKKNSYRIHIMTHFNRKLTCPICPFTTNGQFNLQSHINGHKYKFNCVECGKVCNSKKTYDYHMCMHTGVKKYQCLYCGRCFGTHNMREVHTRIHTGEKPYACDVCGHRARQPVDIKRHKLTHETEKKFSCAICSKKFFHKEYMLAHMRKHSNISMYKCPECDRTFTHPGGLKVHVMFKHLKDRPVECKYCNVKFINDNQLQKHSKSLYHQRNKYAYETNKEARVEKKRGRRS